MSHLREPAARAERREGGRHGRPGPRAAREAAPEAQIRRQLQRASVLPAIAVALSGAAAVLCVFNSTAARPSPVAWGVLTAAATVALAGIVAAVVAADRGARAVMDRVGVLRRTTARGQKELGVLVERLRRGEPAPKRPAPTPPTTGEGDEFDQLANELARSQEAALASVVQAAQFSSQAGSEQKVELLVNLARRLQSLVHREIQLLDELENEVEDPELLKGLFHVDHLATRIRRHAENLAVLGGAISRRQWSHPVTMSEVLRSAIAEVEQYSRVKLVPPIEGTLRGHAVADVIHLLAELLENASVYSAPNTQVLLRVSHVTSGLAIEVEDRGLGMAAAEQNEMNALLADPDQVDVANLISGGRIGLFVVAALARRHGVAVRLQTNIYGGMQAIIVLPQGLLGADDPAADTDAHPTDQAAAQPPQAHTPPPPAQTPHPHPQPQADGQQQPRQPQLAPQLAHAQQTPPQPAHARHAQPQPQPQPEFTSTGPLPVAVPHREPHGADVPVHAAGAQTVRRPRGADAPALTLHTATHAPVAPVPAQAPRAEHGADAGAGRPPLPVRDAHEPRANPADVGSGGPLAAQPPVDRPSGPPLTPTGVRGTIGRPQLPKRRAQEHLVPQLREAPVPPPAAVAEEPPEGHDPGLMAAFQRGIGLAEAHPDPRPGADPDPSTSASAATPQPSGPPGHPEGSPGAGSEPPA